MTMPSSDSGPKALLYDLLSNAHVQLAEWESWYEEFISELERADNEPLEPIQSGTEPCCGAPRYDDPTEGVNTPSPEYCGDPEPSTGTEYQSVQVSRAEWDEYQGMKADIEASESLYGQLARE